MGKQAFILVLNCCHKLNELKSHMNDSYELTSSARGLPVKEINQ